MTEAALAFILARLRERSTVTDLIAGAVAFAFLPRPYGGVALGFAVLKGLIPDAPPAKPRRIFPSW